MLILLMAVTTLGTAYSQSTMAHVNTQKVLDTMPSRKSAMTELENFERRAVKELQETQQKLQGDYTKLQQEKPSMSPTAFKFEEERLMKKSQEFQTRQQELDEQIQILSNELNAPILKTVQDAVAKVCKAEKVDYVVDESSLLYSGGRDLTALVVKEVLRIEREAAAKVAGEKK